MYFSHINYLRVEEKKRKLKIDPFYQSFLSIAVVHLNERRVPITSYESSWFNFNPTFVQSEESDFYVVQCNRFTWITVLLRVFTWHEEIFILGFSLRSTNQLIGRKASSLPLFSFLPSSLSLFFVPPPYSLICLNSLKPWNKVKFIST